MLQIHEKRSFYQISTSRILAGGNILPLLYSAISHRLQCSSTEVQHLWCSCGACVGAPSSPGSRHHSELVVGGPVLAGLPTPRGPCAIGQPLCLPCLAGRDVAGYPEIALAAAQNRSWSINVLFLNLLLWRTPSPWTCRREGQRAWPP